MNDQSKNIAKQYWEANVKLMILCLSVWAFVSFGLGILLRPLLINIQIGGIDLSFWFAQQGSIYTFMILIFFYAWRMNALDKKFELEE